MMINFTQYLFFFIPAGHVLPAVLVLLPEHPPVGAPPGNPGGHAPVSARVPEKARPQTPAGRVPAETSTKNHQVSAALEGPAQVTHCFEKMKYFPFLLCFVRHFA